MPQNVGPILEMVTEKYLLRSEAEWAGRQAIGILDEIRVLAADDVSRLGGLTTRNFFGPPGDHPLGEQPLHRAAHRAA